MRYLFPLIIFLTGCSSLFYFPMREKAYDPAEFNLKYEDISFESGKEAIHGWWFPAETKKAKGTFIFFHGNAENLSTHFLNLRWLPQKGYNFLIFDYPGYGRSTGNPTRQSTVDAGKSAIRWVWLHKDKNPIIYGQSLGGIIAMRSFETTREEGSIKALILDSTFINYHKIAQKKLRYSWLTWIFQPLVCVLVSNAEAPDKISQYSPVPVLVMHGQKDQVVEPEFGDELFNKLSEPKEFWSIPDSDHGQNLFIENGKYQDKLLKYIESI